MSSAMTPELIAALRQAIAALRHASAVATGCGENEMRRTLDVAAWEIEQAIEDAEGNQP